MSITIQCNVHVYVHIHTSNVLASAHGQTLAQAGVRVGSQSQIKATALLLQQVVIHLKSLQISLLERLESSNSQSTFSSLQGSWSLVSPVMLMYCPIFHLSSSPPDETSAFLHHLKIDSLLIKERGVGRSVFHNTCSMKSLHPLHLPKDLAFVCGQQGAVI